MSTATCTEHGNGDVARGGEILRTVVGSGVHGIAIPGTDDHDEMGLEIVRDGRLTLPMPAAEREETLAVKRSGFPVLDEVLARIAGVQAEIEERLASGRTPLPADPDVAAVTAWAVEPQRRFWGWV